MTSKRCAATRHGDDALIRELRGVPARKKRGGAPLGAAYVEPAARPMTAGSFRRAAFRRVQRLEEQVATLMTEPARGEDEIGRVKTRIETLLTFRRNVLKS